MTKVSELRRAVALSLKYAEQAKAARDLAHNTYIELVKGYEAANLAHWKAERALKCATITQAQREVLTMMANGVKLIANDWKSPVTYYLDATGTTSKVNGKTVDTLTSLLLIEAKPAPLHNGHRKELRLTDAGREEAVRVK